MLDLGGDEDKSSFFSLLEGEINLQSLKRVSRARPYSHGHFKLLHPLPLRLLGFTEELEALLPLQVDQVETIGPLGRREREPQTAGRCLHRNDISKVKTLKHVNTSYD